MKLKKPDLQSKSPRENVDEKRKLREWDKWKGKPGEKTKGIKHFLEKTVGTLEENKKKRRSQLVKSIPKPWEDKRSPPKGRGGKQKG